MGLAQDVELGMDLLDRRNPGWDERINLTTLDISSITRCVLGQLYGSFGLGMLVLGISGGKQYGFISSRYASIEEEYSESEVLTDLWKQRIGERQRARVQEPVPHADMRPYFLAVEEYIDLVDEALLV